MSVTSRNVLVVHVDVQVDSFERVLRGTAKPLFYETEKGLMKKTELCLDICIRMSIFQWIHGA